MAKRDSTKVLWQVQVKAKNGAWINKGRFETRRDARAKKVALRAEYGFGNTREIRVEKKR